jgi:hypothetical protein
MKYYRIWKCGCSENCNEIPEDCYNIEPVMTTTCRYCFMKVVVTDKTASEMKKDEDYARVLSL